MLCRVFLLTWLVLIPLFADDYEVSVTTVSVWVKVLDGSGKPVEGLKQEDFELSEDKSRVSLTCFEEVKGTTSAPAASTSTSIETSAQAPSHKMVFFLDLYNTSPAEIGMIQPKVVDFLRKIRGTTWEVMLAAFLPNSRLGIVVPFTKDTARVESALEQAKGNAQRDQRIRASRREITRTLEMAVLGPNRVDGRIFPTVVSNGYSLAERFAKEEQKISEVSVGALASFSDELSKRTGLEHVALLYISGGVHVDPGRQYFDIVDRFVEFAGSSTDLASRAIQFPNSVRSLNNETRKGIKENIGRLNRQNITLYAINTRGTVDPAGDTTQSSSPFDKFDPGVLQDYQDSMIQIATESGGLSFQNSNNFELGFNNILNDLDHYYLLCYNAPKRKQENKYHSIKVRVSRPDVKIRHRAGYLD